MTTFCYRDDHADNGTETEPTMLTFWAYCRDEAEATDVRDEIQTVCGTGIERDGDFLYVIVCRFMIEEAIACFHAHGYAVSKAA